jgi:hypothetical protein
MKAQIRKLNSGGGSLPGPPWLNLLRFGAYPRLTAPNRGKTRLFALNRAQKFSGDSRACNRGCTRRTATNCPRSHQLAHNLANKCFCAKRNSSCFLGAPCGAVVRSGVTPNNGKSRLLTPFKKYSPKPLLIDHNPTHNSQLTLGNQSKVNVAYCRLSRIRTWGCTGVAIHNRHSKFATRQSRRNLNTRNAGLPTGRSRGIPASPPNLNISATLTDRSFVAQLGKRPYRRLAVSSACA